MSQSNEPMTTPPMGDGPALHNPVLTRDHEPPRAGNHSWIMLGGLAVAVIAGAAFWAFAASHPAGPMVNHAVGEGGPTYQTAQNAKGQ